MTRVTTRRQEWRETTTRAIQAIERELHETICECKGKHERHDEEKSGISEEWDRNTSWYACGKRNPSPTCVVHGRFYLLLRILHPSYTANSGFTRHITASVATVSTVMPIAADAV